MGNGIVHGKDRLSNLSMADFFIALRNILEN